MKPGTAEAEDKLIYLHYTQAELDRNFDQRGWIKNAQEVISRYISRSKSTRERLKFQTASYGPGDDQTLDIFPAGTGGSPVVVFTRSPITSRSNWAKDRSTLSVRRRSVVIHMRMLTPAISRKSILGTCSIRRLTGRLTARWARRKCEFAPAKDH
jgi:hypothetical protein